MQPNQQQDNVWISREEYERLRQQAQQPLAQAVLHPVVYGATAQTVADEPAKVSQTQAVVGALLAIGLFLSLTVPFFKLLSIPILGIMVVFAGMSLSDFLKAKQPKNNPAQIGVVGGQVQKKAARKYHALLVILLVILAAPVVLVGSLLVLFFVIMAANGGHGS